MLEDRGWRSEIGGSGSTTSPSPSEGGGRRGATSPLSSESGRGKVESPQIWRRHKKQRRPICLRFLPLKAISLTQDCQNTALDEKQAV